MANLPALYRRHPWLKSVLDKREAWNAQVRKRRSAGETDEAITASLPAPSVAEQIAFAKYVQDTPDVWSYFANAVQKERETGKLSVEPDASFALGALADKYLLDTIGSIRPGDTLVGARALIFMFLRGELDSMSGPEAENVVKRFL